MGLISDALRWLPVPKSKPCDAVWDDTLACDLLYPHPDRDHYDETQRVRWMPVDEEAA